MLAATCAATVLLFACSRDINNKEAVRQGVVDYLNKRTGQTGLDMKLMDVAVSNVSFQDNEATATVSFKPKTGGAEGMSMNYALERRGDKWVVKGRKETGVNPHGATGMPGASMPSGTEMPPNHPPVQSPKPDNK
jgi:hypothetical protein